jgi:hypothetical protein
MSGQDLIDESDAPSSVRQPPLGHERFADPSRLHEVVAIEMDELGSHSPRIDRERGRHAHCGLEERDRDSAMAAVMAIRVPAIDGQPAARPPLVPRDIHDVSRRPPRSGFVADETVLTVSSGCSWERTGCRPRLLTPVVQAAQMQNASRCQAPAGQNARKHCLQLPAFVGPPAHRRTRPARCRPARRGRSLPRPSGTGPATVALGLLVYDLAGRGQGRPPGLRRLAEMTGALARAERPGRRAGAGRSARHR